MMNARWTSTSVPSTSLLIESLSRMSPWRYSVFWSPSSAGSNGRRAIPMMRSISGSLSSRRRSARPMSPVGPVIATFRPTDAARLADAVCARVHRGDQADVPARDEHERHGAFLTGLEGRDRAVGHRQEFRLTLVHVVRQARPVALGG